MAAYVRPQSMTDDDQRPPTVRSARRAPEFWLLLIAALAAAAGVAAWIVVPLTVAGLSISSLPKYTELWPRVVAAGAEREGWKTIALSLFNNIAAGCGAFVAGVFTRWLWFGW